jgi:thioredoxin reductase
MNEIKRARVAIVGGGPAGIGVALGLAACGVRGVLLLDRAAELGGIPAKYPAESGGVRTFVAYGRGRVLFGRDFLLPLIKRLLLTPTEVWRETQVIAVDRERKTLTTVSPALGRHEVEADAIVFATGAREQTATERGWIAGSRLARMLFTTHVVELLDKHAALPGGRVAIAGSDLIAYSAAAKLRNAGAANVVVVDRNPAPSAPAAARLYFRFWGGTEFVGPVDDLTIEGTKVVQRLSSHEREVASADAVVFGGALVPNSELIVESGLAVTPPHGVPVVRRGGSLSTPGFFIAGNVLGGFRGADWCYRNGQRIARSVARWLAGANP